MRALFWITGILAALWSGYWVVGSTAVERATNSWFAEQQGALQVSNQGVVVHGFPNRFDLTVTGLHLADPSQGIGWDTEFLQIFAMTWKPWHLITALAPRQTITLPDQTLTLQSDRLMGSLLMVPGGTLALNEGVAEGEGLHLSSTLGWALAADKSVASLRADPTRLNTYRAGLSVTNFAPDPALIAATAMAPLITDVHLDAHLTLSAPIDRQTARTNPRLTGLDLTEARLVWGDFKLSAKGSLAPDANGLASGEITIRIENWRQLPGLLAAMGVIAPGFAPTLEKGLEIMANAGPDPAVLDLPLTAAGGRLSLGPFPLGPAPAL